MLTPITNVYLLIQDHDNDMVGGPNVSSEGFPSKFNKSYIACIRNIKADIVLSSSDGAS